MKLYFKITFNQQSKGCMVRGNGGGGDKITDQPSSEWPLLVIALTARVALAMRALLVRC